MSSGSSTNNVGALGQIAPELGPGEGNGALQSAPPEPPLRAASLQDGDPESAPSSGATRTEYKASIYQSDAISPELGEALEELGAALGGMAVWLLVQDGQASYEANSVSEAIADQLFLQRDELKPGEPVAVVIDSLGGDAREAYRIATLLRKQCGGFVAVVPRMAKSAATLFAFGADQIVLGEFGELGPLDVQIRAEPGEPFESALNEVEAVQRLRTDVLAAVDETMWLLLPRLLKKPDAVLPHAIELVTKTMRPLLEKVDTKLYTKRSRELKVGEDYAARLLTNRYPKEAAKAIAQSFVHDYADHIVIIDAEEAARVMQEAQKATHGLVDASLAPLTAPMTPELCRILNQLLPRMRGLTAVGLLRKVEVTDDPPAQD
ncbi:MAG: hypothetical protein M3Q10_10445 [Chloroflexota bacterium]|nr:hypothetical protein [Chloroflexota bacterium]